MLGRRPCAKVTRTRTGVNRLTASRGLLAWSALDGRTTARVPGAIGGAVCLLVWGDVRSSDELSPDGRGTLPSTLDPIAQPVIALGTGPEECHATSQVRVVGHDERLIRRVGRASNDRVVTSAGACMEDRHPADMADGGRTDGRIRIEHHHDLDGWEEHCAQRPRIRLVRERLGIEASLVRPVDQHASAARQNISALQAHLEMVELGNRQRLAQYAA